MLIIIISTACFLTDYYAIWIHLYKTCVMTRNKMHARVSGKSAPFSEPPWPAYRARGCTSAKTRHSKWQIRLWSWPLWREESPRETSTGRILRRKGVQIHREPLSCRSALTKRTGLFPPPAHTERRLVLSGEKERYGDLVRETRGQDSTISANGGTKCSARASGARRHEATTRQHVGAAF